MRDNAELGVQIAFIGAGRVAATLAQAVHFAGLHVAAIFSRDNRDAEDVACAGSRSNRSGHGTGGG